MPLAGEVAGRHARMRVRRPGHVAHHARQVELEHALVLRRLQAVRPESGLLRVGLHEPHLRVVPAGELQVLDRLRVDVEHRRRGAVLRRHVGDGGPVAQRQRGGAVAMELEVGADHLRLAQELGEREHDVGGGDARLALAAELYADNLGQAHPRRTAQHHVLGLEAADADGDHAEGIHVRRVAVGADAGVGKCHAVLRLDHRRHLLQVDLVHDAVAGGNHVHVVEREAGPVDEVEPVLVAAVLDGAVLGERVRIVATALDRQRVVHDQLHRHHRVHPGRVATLVRNRIAQAGEVDERGLAEDVVAHHARRKPREVAVPLHVDDLLQALVDDRRIGAAHDVLRVHARGVRQPVPGAGPDRVHCGARVEVVEGGAGKGLAESGVHGTTVRK